MYIENILHEYIYYNMLKYYMNNKSTFLVILMAEEYPIFYTTVYLIQFGFTLLFT